VGESVTDTGVLHRIVCGVDGSAESLFAVRQAARLLPPEGRLLLVAAVSFAKAAHAGIPADQGAPVRRVA